MRLSLSLLSLGGRLGLSRNGSLGLLGVLTERKLAVSSSVFVSVFC